MFQLLNIHFSYMSALGSFSMKLTLLEVFISKESGLKS